MSRIRDNALLDAIEGIKPVYFDGPAWRAVRSGHDPLRASATGGRWDDGTFEVLYTSQSRDGAIAELRYHLANGQPVIPSRVKYDVCELSVCLNGALKLLDLDALAALGVDITRYGTASYVQRKIEYPRTQEVGEAAHFLGFDGIIAPSARYQCLNTVLFDDMIASHGKALVENHGVIDTPD